jgi:hypothetical protein
MQCTEPPGLTEKKVAVLDLGPIPDAIEDMDMDVDVDVSARTRGFAFI